MAVDFSYSSLASIVNAAEKNNTTISALILAQQAQQMEQSEEALYAHMRENFQVMSQCIEPGSREDLKSTSGLTGGRAFKMRRAAESGQALTGSLMAGALYRALAVSELNAAMGRIVAAPTAGSCGILPAALLTMEAERGCTERACVMAMFTASAIGMVIANNASLAGAEGGCQAECGSAAAMAAGAITELAGGSPRQISHAVAIALKNILGLVCGNTDDPHPHLKPPGQLFEPVNVEHTAAAHFLLVHLLLGIGRADLNLDMLGRGLANLIALGVAHVIDNGLIETVTADTHGA